MRPETRERFWNAALPFLVGVGLWHALVYKGCIPPTLAMQDPPTACRHKPARCVLVGGVSDAD